MLGAAERLYGKAALDRVYGGLGVDRSFFLDSKKMTFWKFEIFLWQTFGDHIPDLDPEAVIKEMVLGDSNVIFSALRLVLTPEEVCRSIAKNSKSVYPVQKQTVKIRHSGAYTYMTHDTVLQPQMEPAQMELYAWATEHSFRCILKYNLKCRGLRWKRVMSESQGDPATRWEISWLRESTALSQYWPQFLMVGAWAVGLVLLSLSQSTLSFPGIALCTGALLFTSLAISWRTHKKDPRNELISAVIESAGDESTMHHELQRRERQLEQAHRLESVGLLAGGIAHDFNNILQIIMGNTDLLKRRAMPDPRVQDRLNRIEEAAERGRNLVEQILTFSRRRGAPLKAISLGKTIAEAMKFIRNTWPASLELKVELTGADGTIIADEGLIYQILVNLCANARDAMKEEGGTLSVSCQKVGVGAELLDRMPVLKNGEHVRLRASDTGEGIENDVLDRVFDPFYTTKEVGEGSGLGLAVVYGIVGELGGAIDVVTKVGEGTQFDLYFPLAEAAAGAVEGRRSAIRGGTDGRQQRVLLIDDEASVLEQAQQGLEEKGFVVTAMNCPIEALVAFRDDSGAFDAVVTDLTMPGLTGLALARSLRGIREDIPIVLCTGYDARRSSEPEMEVISHCLQKPIRPENLAAVIVELTTAAEYRRSENASS
jgi:signal transduction histidine kinase/ActR/RegA family two-component response regulator